MVMPIATAQQVLAEISAMAMVNPQDCFDEDGHLLPVRQLPEVIARALAGFEFNDAGALKKIRLEKARALENLAKYHDRVQPDNSSQVQVTINISDEQAARLEA